MAMANIATTLIGLVDTAILGHLENSSYIGGAAVATTLFNLIFLSFGFLRMGTTGLIAQHYGERDHQALYSTLAISALIAIFFGIVVVVLKSFIFETAFPLIGGSEAVQTQAFAYANIRVLSAPFILLNFVTLGCLIGLQKSRLVLYTLLLSQSLNVILDFYLGVYLGWNIEGVAWATVISDIFGCGIALIFIAPIFGNKGLKWFHLENIAEHCQKIFKLNTDIFIRTILLLSTLAFVTAQGAKLGDITLAANAIILQLFFFIANIIDGFANAAESTTGESMGQKRKGLSSYSFSQIFKAAFAQASLATAGTLIALFLWKATIFDLLIDLPEVLFAINHYIVWLVIVMVCAIIAFVMDGVFVGATHSREMLFSILGALIFAFFPLWYLTQSLENHGLWLSLCGFMLFRSLLTLFFLKRMGQKF